MIEIIIASTFSILLIVGIIACIILTYQEEKRRCKHQWSETDRSSGISMGGFMVTKIFLECKKCGDVKCRTLS